MGQRRDDSRHRVALLGVHQNDLPVVRELAADVDSPFPDCRRHYSHPAFDLLRIAVSGAAVAMLLSVGSASAGVLVGDRARFGWHDPSTQALVGHDRNGGRLRPMTTDEQEAFVRAVLRGAQIVTAAAADDRSGDDLLHQLGQLAGIHGIALPQLPANLRLSRLIVIVPPNPAAPGCYLLDVPAVKAEWGQPDKSWVDLTVQFLTGPRRSCTAGWSTHPTPQC